MSTVRTWQIESTGLEATLELAAQIGSRLQGGEVVELISDLGGGKTTFVRGLARGMGSQDKVHSPSFALCNQYKAGTLTLHHFDFYRLDEPGIMRDDLAEKLKDPHTVTIVEWASAVNDVLPADRLSVTISVTGETSRQFIFKYPSRYSYLFTSKT